MTGLSAIFRKEVGDSTSYWTFQASFLLLFIGLALGGMNAAFVYNNIYDIYVGVPENIPRIHFFRFFALGILPQIIILGSLMAAALSFDSLCAERAAGNMKIVLSYPVYRDQVFFAKFIANLFILSTVTLTSLGVALGVFLLYTNIAVTGELLIRMVVFAGTTSLFLSIFLSVGMLASLLFNELSTVILSIFLLIGVLKAPFTQAIGYVLSEALVGDPHKDTVAREVMMNVYFLSPIACYEEVSKKVFSLYTTSTISSTTIYVPTNLLEQMIGLSIPIITLFVSLLAPLTLAYVLFSKKDLQ